jgi:hypothetical protein
MSLETTSSESLTKSDDKDSPPITGSEVIIAAGYLLVQNEILIKRQKLLEKQLGALRLNSALLTLAVIGMVIAVFLK